MLRLGAIAIFAVLAAYVSYFAVGPEIDNRLNILTVRDLSQFRGLPIGSGGSLGAVIESRAGSCEWLAAHGEYIWATNVECVSNGNRTLAWEISHQPPRPWLEPQAVYVTPLSRHAAALVPELLPRRTRVEQVPTSRFGSGALYDLAKP